MQAPISAPPSVGNTSASTSTSKPSQDKHKLPLTPSILIPPPLLASSRYNRQLLVPQISISGQERLANAKVLIVGIGGLGSPASLYLAGAGIGTIGLLDDDSVELSNLHRQVVHRESSAQGAVSKAQSALSTLREVNSEITYITHQTRLSPSNALEIVRRYDVVLDCTDNPATRYLISDVCVLLEKVVVSGAAQRTDGQLMVLNYPVGMGPCYRCVFPVPPAPEMARSCSEIGVLGTAVGTIGVLMAGEAIRVIVDRDKDTKQGWKGTLLLYNAWPKDPRSMFRSVGLRPKRKDCISCGEESAVKEREKNKITSKGFEDGSMDYETWCGKIEDVILLEDRERVDAKTFMMKMGQGETETSIIVDVREEAEFALGPKISASVNIPISRILRQNGSQQESKSEVTELVDQIDEGGEQPLYFVCQRGNDSQIAAKKYMDGSRDARRWVGDVRGGLVELEREIARQHNQR